MTSEKYLVSPLWVTTVPYTSWCPRVMVLLPDQTAVAVPHSTDPLSGSHLIHRTGGLLGYRLVISNRGINFVSDPNRTLNRWNDLRETLIRGHIKRWNLKKLCNLRNPQYFFWNSSDPTKTFITNSFHRTIFPFLARNMGLEWTTYLF